MTRPRSSLISLADTPWYHVVNRWENRGQTTVSSNPLPRENRKKKNKKDIHFNCLNP